MIAMRRTFIGEKVGGTSEANESGESVTVLEIYNLFVIHNEPLIVLLEYTISDTIAELIDKSIEARFGGVSLPTAIKDGHGSIINLSNFVTVKANNRDASFGVKVNRSVGRLPVDVRLNSGTHLRFDLTHDERREGLLCDGVLSPPLL